MKKASACGNSNSCVWVGFDLTQDRVLVAVAEDPAAIRLMFTPEEWRVFVEAVQRGEFAVPVLRAEAKEIQAGVTA